MSVKPTYNCDVCGAEKREVNHWWRGYEFGDGFAIAPWDSPREDIFDCVEELHFCGSGCGLKWASAQMAKEEPKEPEAAHA